MVELHISDLIFGLFFSAGYPGPSCPHYRTVRHLWWFLIRCHFYIFQMSWLVQIRRHFCEMRGAFTVLYFVLWETEPSFLSKLKCLFPAMSSTSRKQSLTSRGCKQSRFETGTVKSASISIYYLTICICFYIGRSLNYNIRIHIWDNIWLCLLCKGIWISNIRYSQKIHLLFESASILTVKINCD